MMGILKLFKSKKTIPDELLILYGTKSGNSKLIAQQAEKFYSKKGLTTVCKNISGFAPEQLIQFNKLLLIVSTHGEGEPPPSAKKFYKQCLSQDMPSLKHLSYSICGLGDSSYKEFCWAGKVLDKRFSKLGANPFYPRMDCDEQFSDSAIKWIKGTAGALKNTKNSKVLIKQEESGLSITKNQSYSAKVTERTLLTSKNSLSETHHICLDISTCNLSYQIGDAIEIRPKNPIQLVNLLVDILSLKSKADINDRELTTVSLKTLNKYKNLAKNKKLARFIKEESKLDNYLCKANFLDVLIDFPSKASSKEIIKVLPKLKKRKYSIASSQLKTTNELHLTIKSIRYQFNDLNHEGAASIYANESLTINSDLKFKLCPNQSFSLPKNSDTPIIMVGVSTGIAPYRAMLQERETLGIKGNTWLIWGNKKEADDYLYQKDLEEFKSNEVLEKMDISFSCDSERKQHVYDIIQTQSELVKTWLSKGAHVYVCGSMPMGKSVYETFENICKNSELNMETLIQEDRYHEDVY